ncbi:MAG: cobyrinate a,c-diamide synthase, partial [Pseudomonadota bacterium]
MSEAQKTGLMLAAPSSGSGKTLITLALLRALSNQGVSISPAKAGPDYIDPGFHGLACRSPSINLDPWAMGEERLRLLTLGQPGNNILIEAMMGLYDGAADGSGSAAQLAKTLSVPIVLVVDAAKQSHSIAALVRGFRDHDPQVEIAGVILNKVGSARHEELLRKALRTIDVPVLGAVARNAELELPERHLGLVQASETQGIEAFIDQAAEIVSGACNLNEVTAAFGKIAGPVNEELRLPPIGQRIAIAKDEAFSFIYPHVLNDWWEQGAQIDFFSPLKDEGPAEHCDAVYLPGGYPELHAARLSSAAQFRNRMLGLADEGTLIYGECGGYMVLGEGIIAANGARYAMTGLLKLETSFEKRKLHLGYRKLEAEGFAFGDRLHAHEFHYTSAMKEEGPPLFTVSDALGTDLGNVGLRAGNVMGSYMHVI